MKLKRSKNKELFIEDRIISEDVKFVASKCCKLITKLSNKSILITGANGILGRYLLHSIFEFNSSLKKPCKVYAYITKEISKDNDIYYLKKNKNFFFIKQDLTKNFQIRKNLDYILHAASPADPKTYLNNQIRTLTLNTDTTKKFLEYCVGKKTKFLFFSSGEIYGSPPRKYYPTREDYISKRDHLSIRSCYAESKIFGETLCNVYKETKNVNSLIIRPIYVIGPGFKKTDSRAWTFFIRQAVLGKNIVIKSDGKAVRGACYVADAMIQIFNILINGKKGDLFNVGNSKGVSIKRIAKVVCKVNHKKIKYKILNEENSTKAPMRNVPDMKKTLGKFNIKNYYDIESTIKRTLLWAERQKF